MENTQEIQEWRNELRKLKSSDIYFIDTLGQHEVQILESFISQKLKELEERHKMEIENVKKELVSNLLLNCGLELEEVKLIYKDTK